MTYRFETFEIILKFAIVRNLIAVIALASTVFASNISFSATNGVNFSGFVRPTATAKTTSFAQPIYSFSDKVAVPIFPATSNGSQKDDIRVYTGNAKSGKLSEQVHFETIRLGSVNSSAQQAVVIDMLSSRQAVYICYGKAKTVQHGCVQFTAVKVH